MNFLHNHPLIEEHVKLDTRHVVVDRKEWEIAREIFQNRKAFDLLPLSFGTISVISLPNKKLQKVKMNRKLKFFLENK